MPVYKPFSLTLGCGVAAEGQGMKLSVDDCHLFLGIDQTGTECIGRIKKQLQGSIPDDLNHSNLQFLGIAVDMPEMPVMLEKGLSREEVLVLNSRIADARLRTVEASAEFDWLNPAFEDGRWFEAGNNPRYKSGRQYCRAVFVSEFAMVHARINQILAKFHGKKLYVHIMMDFMRHESSGYFLDLCYLLRQSLAYSRFASSRMIGYCIMPSVYTVHQELMPPVWRDHALGLAYAAMQELDYCMQLPDNGGAFIRQYGGGAQIAWNCPPLDICNLSLLSSYNRQNGSEAYEDTLEQIVQYSVSFVKCPELYATVDHTSVTRQQIRNQSGFPSLNNAYHVIGAFSARIPAREFNTMLLSNLLLRYRDRIIQFEENWEDRAKEKLSDLDAQFWGGTEIKHMEARLLSQLRKNYGPEEVFSPTIRDTLDAQGQNMIQFYENRNHIRTEKMMKIGWELCQPSEENSIANRIQNLVGSLFLYGIQAYIPLLEYLTGNRERGLHATIRFLEQLNQNQLRQLTMQSEQDRSLMETARQEFCAGSFLNRNVRLQRFHMILEEVYNRKLELLEREQLGKILKAYTSQADELSKRISDLQGIYQMLYATAEDNLSYLEHQFQRQDLSGSSTFSMLTRQELQELSEHTLRAWDLDSANPPVLDRITQIGLETVLQGEDAVTIYDKICRMLGSITIHPSLSGQENPAKGYSFPVTGDALLQIALEEQGGPWYIGDRMRDVFQRLKHIDDLGTFSHARGFLSVNPVIARQFLLPENLKQMMNHSNLDQEILRDRNYQYIPGLDHITLVRSGIGYSLAAEPELKQAERQLALVEDSPDQWRGFYSYENVNASMPVPDWRRLPLLTPYSKLDQNSISNFRASQMRQSYFDFEYALDNEMIGWDGSVYLPDQEELNQLAKQIDPITAFIEEEDYKKASAEDLRRMQDRCIEGGERLDQITKKKSVIHLPDVSTIRDPKEQKRILLDAYMANPVLIDQMHEALEYLLQLERILVAFKKTIRKARGEETEDDSEPGLSIDDIRQIIDQELDQIQEDEKNLHISIDDVNERLKKGYQFTLDSLNSMKLNSQDYKLLEDQYHKLFSVNEDHQLIPAYPGELQRIAYELFLIDSALLEINQQRIIDFAIPATTQEVIERQADAEQAEGRTPDDAEESASGLPPITDDARKPDDTDLEIAVLTVLKKFENWIVSYARRDGHEVIPVSHAQRQTTGEQYGYDVGLRFTFDGELYSLNFECKHFTTYDTMDDTKAKALPIAKYAYNFLEYYMNCDRKCNNHWILICPYGNIHNGHQRAFFEQWNLEHPFMHFHVLAQSETILTCKEFLSADEQAFLQVYRLHGDQKSNKTTEEIFRAFYEQILNQETIHQAFEKKMNALSTLYPFWDSFRSHDPLLEIQTVEGLNSFGEICRHLENSQGRGLFIIGEFGTGKSWLMYRFVEMCYRQPANYPYIPIYKELKQNTLNSINSGEIDLDQIREAAEEFVCELLHDYGAILASPKVGKRFVFILDGFDEVLSGLSATDNKIRFLYQVYDRLKKEKSDALFLVTSRESDYMACKNKDFFKKVINDFDKIHLVDCSTEDARCHILTIAKRSQDENVKNRLSELSKSKDFVRIMTRPVFFGFLEILARETHMKDSYTDEYDILDDMLRHVTRKEKQERVKELMQKLYDYAVISTIHGDAPEMMLDKTEAFEDLFVGILRIRKEDKKRRYYYFPHNIIREFLVAKRLFLYLKEAIRRSDEGEPLLIAAESFLLMLRDVPLSYVIKDYFLKHMEHDITDDNDFSDREEDFEFLLKLLQTDAVKGQEEYAGPLFSILLRPGRSLGKNSDDLSPGSVPGHLNLDGIHLENMTLWNCRIVNCSFRHAILKNMELFDVQLDTLDFRDADLTGLKIGSGDRILSTAYHRIGNDWYLSCLYENQKIMEYKVRDLTTWKQYEFKLLDEAVDFDAKQFFWLDGLYIPYNNSEVLLRSPEAYQLLGPSEILQIHTGENPYILYRMNQTDEKMETAGAENVYIFDEQEQSVLSYQIPQSVLANVQVLNRQLLYLDASILYLIRDGIRVALLEWKEEYEAYALYEDVDQKLHIYIKARQTLLHFCYQQEETELLMRVIPITGDVSESCKGLKHLCRDQMGMDHFLYHDEDKLYVLALSDQEAVSRVLQSRVECDGLILENEDGSSRVRDERVYRILKQ